MDKPNDLYRLRQPSKSNSVSTSSVAKTPLERMYQVTALSRSILAVEQLGPNGRQHKNRRSR